MRRAEGATRQSRRSASLHVLSAILIFLSTQAVGREHGRPRLADQVVGIILHSIGGPECTAGAVTFRPIPSREDDADFWQQMLLRAPVADAHFVIGRSGTVRP